MGPPGTSHPPLLPGRAGAKAALPCAPCSGVRAEVPRAAHPVRSGLAVPGWRGCGEGHWAGGRGGGERIQALSTSSLKEHTSFLVRVLSGNKDEDIVFFHSALYVISFNIANMNYLSKKANTF